MSRHGKERDCRGAAIGNYAGDGAPPKGRKQHDRAQSRSERRGGKFQPDSEADPKSRRGKSAPGAVAVLVPRDPDEAVKRGEQEQRAGEVVRRRSQERNESGPGYAHQPGHGPQRHALDRLDRSNHLADDPEQQGGIDAVHGPHDEGDDARRLVERRADQPVKQQVRDRIIKALFLGGTDVIEITVVQIGPRRIEVVIAQVPVVIGPQHHRQESRARADEHEYKAESPWGRDGAKAERSPARRPIDCGLLVDHAGRGLAIDSAISR